MEHGACARFHRLPPEPDPAAELLEDIAEERSRYEWAQSREAPDLEEGYRLGFSQGYLERFDPAAYAKGYREGSRDRREANPGNPYEDGYENGLFARFHRRPFEPTPAAELVEDLLADQRPAAPEESPNHYDRARYKTGYRDAYFRNPRYV